MESKIKKWHKTNTYRAVLQGIEVMYSRKAALIGNNEFVKRINGK